MEETIGKRIAKNRKRMGLTQDRLSELLGTPRTVDTTVETGDNENDRAVEASIDGGKKLQWDLRYGCCLPESYHFILPWRV